MQKRKLMDELRNLDDDGVEERLAELQSELIRLRFQLAIRQLENHQRLGQVRRQIAQVRTLQRERQLAEVFAAKR